VLALVGTIIACFGVELWMTEPNWWGVSVGFLPSLQRLSEPGALYVAIGIVGATVMPHNLYLHSALVQRRWRTTTPLQTKEAVAIGSLDAVLSLSVAFLVNASILIVAATVFHRTGQSTVSGIEDAYRLLDPLLGGAASILFGVALLASGQSSTLTGTLAGQIVLEGFMNFRMAPWKRRLLARSLAIVPALLGIWWFGEQGAVVNKMLVLSQVVLSFQLPFAIWPLLRFTSDRRLMGSFVSGPWTQWVTCAIFGCLVGANAWLVFGFLSGS
jgi:manganese transport protein